MTRQINQIRWASARLLFIVYIGFSVVSLVGGFLTAPLMTWYFFGDWRFWRHWSAGLGLLPHAFKLSRVMFTDNRGFMFSVPLTSPPRTSPDLSATTLHPFWPHGSACGNCSNCCRAGGYACPLLDESRSLCRGYDSFYWRYFNCGRFPTTTSEIDYYNCRKWVLAPVVVFKDPLAPAPRIEPVGQLAKRRAGTPGQGLAQETHRRHHEAPAMLDAETDLAAPVVPPGQARKRDGWSTGKGNRP